jgi:hypothetical protein
MRIISVRLGILVSLLFWLNQTYKSSNFFAHSQKYYTFAL